jgi:RNA polymerase sigma factor (sigma-70 family)
MLLASAVPAIQIMSENPFATKLYEQYQGLWFRVAMQIVRNTDDARDVVQEAYRKFLAVEKDWASFEDARRYFSTILTNTAIDYYKFARRRVHRHTDLDDFSPLEEVAVADWHRPWDDLERKREELLLEECKELVQALPSAQRQAIELLYLSNDPSSLTESSRLTGVPISTLKSRATVGIEKLKKCLRKKRLI